MLDLTHDLRGALRRCPRLSLALAVWLGDRFRDADTCRLTIELRLGQHSAGQSKWYGNGVVGEYVDEHMACQQ